MIGCNISVYRDSKYFVSFEDENNFYIVGFTSKINAMTHFNIYNGKYKSVKIGEIKGQVTIENLFFDYMTKFRGKIWIQGVL